MQLGKKEVGIIIAVCGLAFTFLGFVYSNRPIVDYKLSEQFEVGDVVTFDNFSPSLAIQAQIRNRGGTDAPLYIILSLENASFVDKNPNSVYLENDRILKIYVQPIAKQEYYVHYLTHLAPDEECQSFSIQYQIEKRPTSDLFKGLINNFIDSNAWTPIYMKFDRVDENSFERIQ